MLKHTFFVVGKHVKEHPEIVKQAYEKDILLLTMAIAIIIHYCTKMKKVFEMKF